MEGRERVGSGRQGTTGANTRAVVVSLLCPLWHPALPAPLLVPALSFHRPTRPRCLPYRRGTKPRTWQAPARGEAASLPALGILALLRCYPEAVPRPRPLCSPVRRRSDVNLMAPTNGLRSNLSLSLTASRSPTRKKMLGAETLQCYSVLELMLCASPLARVWGRGFTV